MCGSCFIFAICGPCREITVCLSKTAKQGKPLNDSAGKHRRKCRVTVDPRLHEI